MFVLVTEYTGSMEPEALAEHRAHVGRGYDRGLLLLSGRRVGAVGGIHLAGGTRDDVERFTADDPVVRAGTARYTVIELEPTRGVDDLVAVLAARGIPTGS